MFLKVVWNREDMPDYTMISCSSYIVRREVKKDNKVFLHIMTENPEHTVCVSGNAVVFVMNENGKTIDTLHVV